MSESFAEQDGKMSEHLAAYDENMRERFAAQDKRMQERFAAQDEKMNERFAAQDRKMDERFAAQDAKIDAHTVYLMEQMAQTIESAIAVQKRNQAESEERIIRQLRLLAENIEGIKIQALYEESKMQQATLENHETRIDKLEQVAG